MPRASSTLRPTHSPGAAAKQTGKAFDSAARQAGKAAGQAGRAASFARGEAGRAARQAGKAVLGATEKVLDVVSTPGRMALDAAGGAAVERAAQRAAVRHGECEAAREAAAEQAARVTLFAEQAAYRATVVLEQRRRLQEAERAYDDTRARPARRERVRVRDEGVRLRRQRRHGMCVGLPVWLAVAECLPSLAVARPALAVAQLGGTEYLPSWMRLAAEVRSRTHGLTARPTCTRMHARMHPPRHAPPRPAPPHPTLGSRYADPTPDRGPRPRLRPSQWGCAAAAPALPTLSPSPSLSPHLDEAGVALLLLELGLEIWSRQCAWRGAAAARRDGEVEAAPSQYLRNRQRERMAAEQEAHRAAAAALAEEAPHRAAPHRATPCRTAPRHAAPRRTTLHPPRTSAPRPAPQHRTRLRTAHGSRPARTGARARAAARRRGRLRSRVARRGVGGQEPAPHRRERRRLATARPVERWGVVLHAAHELVQA